LGVFRISTWGGVNREAEDHEGEGRGEGILGSEIFNFIVRNVTLKGCGMGRGNRGFPPPTD